MSEPFSLLQNAWIPVALDDGRRVFVRPCDIATNIDSKSIIRIATGRPDCDISLTEFLIGLLAVTLAPTGARDWRKRFTTPPSPDDLQSALLPFEPAMILDGDGARFFQDFEPLEGEANEIAALFIDAPGSNTVKENADHFVKRGRTSMLSRAGAAIALATLQTSAPSGGAGHRTSLRGGGPLTTLVFPGTKDSAEPNLWQRLWANVPDAVDDNDRTSLADAPLIFSWLGRTRLSDKTGTATTPNDVHPAQAFFGMPRRVRLNFTANITRQPCDLLGIVDDVIVTSFVTRPWGINYTAWSRRHPLSPYYRPKKTDSEFLPVHLKSSRVGYRQWLGLVMEAQEGMRVPAKCLDIWRKRAADFEGDDAVVKHNARLLVAGYSMDKMKPLDFAEALLPLIVTGDEECDKAMKQIASDWVNGADDVANQLVSAVKRALYGEKGQVERDSTVLDAVKSRFWAQTERDFYAMLRKAADRTEAHQHELTDQLYIIKESEGVEWLKALRRDALGIFDATVPIESADGDRIGDVIAGRKMLGLMLSGYGKRGSDLFDKLGQARVETKKGSKAA